MSTPYLGQIKLCAFSFPPKGFAFCNGQLMAISQNAALFSLLGTTYGGNGQTTFALPDLRGRTPLHADGGPFVLGQQVGEEAHTLTSPEIPAHTHALNVNSGAGASSNPAGAVLAQPPAGLGNAYGSGPSVALAPDAIAPTGGGQPHENHQPYLTINFVIALQGIFPSRN